MFRAKRAYFDYIRENLGQSNMFAFGIGESVNRYLIEGMAKAGMGEPFIVGKESEAEAMAERFREYIQTPVLTKYPGQVGQASIPTTSIQPTSQTCLPSVQ
jgi:Ca-activated chloride channel family protein